MASNPLLDRDYAPSTCRTLMSGGEWTVPEADRPVVVEASVVNRAGFTVDAEGRRVNTLDRLLGLERLEGAERVKAEAPLMQRATWNNGNGNLSLKKCAPTETPTTVRRSVRPVDAGLLVKRIGAFGPTLDPQQQDELFEMGKCPRCASRDAWRNGHTRGIQSYRCKACGAGFSERPRRRRYISPVPPAAVAV
jgi:predicted RNA-binding Zn-ribbon protein involved in translation (DUF1610 family)